jgi:uncharacterized protein YprB with RNaseH-like and TPR domain
VLGGSAFGRKLARLHSQDGQPARVDSEREASSPESRAEPARTPTLEELRGRIAAVIARTNEPKKPPKPRPDEVVEQGFGVLPFLQEDTEKGPLYLARKSTPIASRFGVAPLYPAILADASLLALLALDPEIESVDPKRALFLDTETTGLSGGTGTVAFLIGLAHFDEERETFVVEQVLLRDLGEEAPMLDLVAQRIAEASMIVTYNGKAFDLPLLRTRAVMNRIPAFATRPHLDLLHVARRIHKGSIGSCSLKRIEEEVLGHVRFEDVAGQECALSYLHYLRSRNEAILAGVVEHNMCDVLAMVALVGFYGEPVGALSPRDLAGVASTVRRAASFNPSALERALAIANTAVEKGGGAKARRVRGDIEKARGEKLRAIVEYEAAADEVEDPTLRLALAKLYEHAAKSFDKALEVVMRGTGESPEASAKRRSRLVKKLGSA